MRTEEGGVRVQVYVCEKRLVVDLKAKAKVNLVFDVPFGVYD